LVSSNAILQNEETNFRILARYRNMFRKWRFVVTDDNRHAASKMTPWDFFSENLGFPLHDIISPPSVLIYHQGL
jgi:hypothetical protein